MILCFMQNGTNSRKETVDGSVEFQKGCPACEQSDPALEHELQAFAQLLFDIYLAKREGEQESDTSSEG